jgi:hypothetical protein
MSSQFIILRLRQEVSHVGKEHAASCTDKRLDNGLPHPDGKGRSDQDEAAESGWNVGGNFKVAKR